MHAMSGGPTKHEISDREEDNAEKSGYETMFGGSKSIFLDVGNEVLELVDEKAGDADGASDANGDKTKACFAEVEVVDWWVDEGEGFEEGVVDSVRQGSLFNLSVVSFCR